MSVIRNALYAVAVLTLFGVGLVMVIGHDRCWWQSPEPMRFRAANRSPTPVDPNELREPWTTNAKPMGHDTARRRDTSQGGIPSRVDHAPDGIGHPGGKSFDPTTGASP